MKKETKKEEDTTELENILNDFRAAQDDARRWGNRMDSCGEEEFEEALRAYASQSEARYSLREVNDRFNEKLATLTEENKDKEKALNYLHHSAPIAEALSNPRLISTTKVIQNFENPKIEPRYSLQELDAPYLEAVERGDMETAQRMVLEAAKRAWC